MSDLVGNPEDPFSHNEAQLKASFRQLSIKILVVGTSLKRLVKVSCGYFFEAPCQGTWQGTSKEYLKLILWRSKQNIIDQLGH